MSPFFEDKRRQALKVFVALLAAGLLNGCGFHLRGQTELPFDSAYVNAPDNPPLASQLRRALQASGKTLVARPEEAQVVIHLKEANRYKNILSLSGTGRVREYRLEYKANMRVTVPGGDELLPASEIHLVRDYTYDDQQTLAKEQEESQLFQAMEQDALYALLRRLRFAKP